MELKKKIIIFQISKHLTWHIHNRLAHTLPIYPKMYHFAWMKYRVWVFKIYNGPMLVLHVLMHYTKCAIKQVHPIRVYLYIFINIGFYNISVPWLYRIDLIYPLVASQKSLCVQFTGVSLIDLFFICFFFFFIATIMNLYLSINAVDSCACDFVSFLLIFDKMHQTKATEKRQIKTSFWG